MNPALRIARALDQHLGHATPVVIFGTGALLLDPAFEARLAGRMTNDIDLIIPQEHEMEIEADEGFWSAIDATNRDLESSGLYLTHIFPEREVVLTPEWKDHAQPISRPEFRHLQVFRPRMLDLILSKMGRGDAKDLDDVRTMLALEPVAFRDVAEAVKNVRVPEIYAEIFPAARSRILAVVQTFEQAPSGPDTPTPDQPA
ncbi:MAG: DUF6036 family nucleotidyltransferase [Opitutaceae bacterium]